MRLNKQVKKLKTENLKDWEDHVYEYEEGTPLSEMEDDYIRHVNYEVDYGISDIIDNVPMALQLLDEIKQHKDNGITFEDEAKVNAFIKKANGFKKKLGFK